MGDIVITPASNDVNSTAGTLVLRSSDLNPISLRTNNTNRLFIDPTGSVGLGTAVPTGGLHINYAPGAFSEALRLQRNGGIFYSFGLDTNFLNIAYNGNVNANNVLVLTNGGYLGVGNLQNALFNLDIASAYAKGIQLRFDASTGYCAQIIPYWDTNTDTRIDFTINRVQNVAPDVMMSVGYDNNVGIGTTRPTYKLDVAGAIGMHDEAQDIDSRFYGATFLRGWSSFNAGSEANITYTTDGTSPVGVEVLSVSSHVWARGPKIRLDKTQNYEVELWVRRQTANTAGDFYVVVSNYDSSGNVIAGDGTDWHYPAAVNPLSATWTKYRFIVGPYGGAKDHSPNARYISVGFIANYTLGTDVIYMTGFKCRPIPRYNNDNLTLFNDGRVGIGTTQPTGVLHLYGNTNSWLTSPTIVMASSSTADASVRNWRIGPVDTAYGNFHIGVSNVRGGVVDSNAEAQAFTITYDQKVGIGLTNPSYKLDVSGNINVISGIYFNDPNIYLEKSNTYDLLLAQNTASANGLYLAGAGNVYVSIDANDNEIDRAFIVQNNSLKAGNELFRIQENARVGIGTNSPTTLLSIGGAGSTLPASGITFGGEAASNIYRSSTDEIKTDGSFVVTNTLVVGGGENGVRILKNGSDSISSTLYLANAGNTRAYNFQQNAAGTNLDFWTYNSSNSWQNSLSFNYDGNIGIATTTPNTKLRVNGSFSQRASGSTAIQEYKNIVTYNSDNYTTGAYVVRTPFQIGNSYEMPIVHVKGYGYGDAKLYDFKVVFYDYAPSHAPISYSLVDLGNDGSPKFLAKDASNYINVCFGQTGDVHYYYRFTVDCITTRQENDYSQGWGMYQTKVANFGFASTGIYALSSPVNFNVANNFVGIGKTNPSAKLDVVGNIYLSADIVGNDGTRGYLLGKDSLSAGRCYLILDPDAADGIGVGSDYLYIAQENTTGVISNSAGPLLLNPGAGSVGIGTTNAVAQFHIGGTASNNNPWMVLDINDTYFKRIVFSEDRSAYGTTTYGGYIGYDASANTVSLGTYENSVENRSINILRDNGYVGIGTTQPLNRFSVISSNSTSYYNTTAPIAVFQAVSPSTVLVAVDGNVDGYYAELKLGNAQSTYYPYSAYIRGIQGAGIDYYRMEFGTSNGSAAATRMTIANNGNIGIGTTNPAGLLHVFSTTGRYINYTPTSATGLLIQKNASVASQGTTVLTLVNAQSTETLVDRGTSLNLDIGYGGTISTAGTIARGARIAALNHSAYDATAANQNAYLSFYTATGGTLTEKVRIKGDGNVGIGTTAIDARLVVLGEMQVSSNTVYTTHFNYGNIGLNFISTANAGATYFRGSDNAVTAMVVNGAGTVGIGVASPATILGVGGAGSTSPASGITFGEDAQANLYRAAEDTIKTDGSLNVAGLIYNGNGAYYSSVSKSTTANWGQYSVILGNASNSAHLIHVSVNGGNVVWAGTFLATNHLSYRPNETWGNVKLLECATYNCSNDDVTLLTLSNSSTSQYGVPALVLKTNGAVNGSYGTGHANSIVVTVNGPSSNGFVLSSSSWTQPYTYQIATSANTKQIFTNEAGRVGIGTVFPVQKFQIDGTVGNPASVGTTQSGIFRISNTTDNATLDFGIRAGGSGAWIQSTDETSLAANYSLLLNPNGGNIGIGLTNPTARLHVSAGTLALNNRAAFINADITTNTSVYTHTLNLVDTSADSNPTSFALGSYSHAVLRNRAEPAGGAGGILDIYTRVVSGDPTVKMTINGAGNVGISSVTPSSTLDVAGTVRFDSLGASETRSVVTQAGQRIFMPSGGAKFLGNSATGAIRIKSPVNGSTDSMHTVKGTVFEYVTGKSFQFLVSFYYYSSTVVQPTAQIIGGSNAGLNRNFTVRVGRDANNAFLIYIGELADTWTYSYVYITEVFFGWSMNQASIDAYQTGWSISTEASAFENVMATIADTQITNWSRNTSSTYYNLGKVGIGTNAPTTLLSVGGPGSTSAASGITFGGDAEVNLYRISEDVLRTDASLNVLGYVSVGSYIYTSAYLQVAQGNIYPGGYTSDLNLNIGNTAGNNWETAIKIRPGSYVGIGTTQPSGKLHVVSTVAGETVLRADGTNGTLFSVVDDLSDSLMSVNNSAGLPVLEVFADDRIVMGQYGSGDLVVRNNKVGIGTTNPTNKLSVIGGASIGSNTYNVAAPSNGLIVEGNVGIGSTSPTAKLEVYSTSTTLANFNGNQVSQVVYFGSTSATSYTDLVIKADNGQGEIFRGGAGYGSWGGASALNIYNTNGPIAFHPNNTANSMFLSSAGYLGIGVTVPAEKLDVRGGIIRSNARISNSEGYPLGHYAPGETVFEIDPTWSQLELQKYFNSSNVTWVAVADAPGGYCIYIDGGVNVGGFADSGFPYIPVDTNDIFYMECWIQNVGTSQGHYMGSQDFDHNFADLGGNPGSYGYWVMSNYNPTTTWTKVSGYISGFSASEVGKFKTGTKYWTPQALFNYTAGTGTRACRISGWKIIKVSHVGDRSFAGNVSVAADLYVADELAVGLPIAAKRVNYGAQINAASASIQLVFGRSATSLGSGAIGADENNTFGVYNVSGGITKQFSVTQQGNVGIGNLTPTSKLYIEGGSANWSETTPGTALGTIHLDPGVTTDNFGNAITFGASDSADGTAAQAGIYVRSDGGYGTKMYFATTDSYGDGSKTRMFISHSGNVGIATTNPIHKLQIGNFTSTSTNSTEKISLGGTYSDTPGSNIKMRVYEDAASIGGMSASSGQMEINTWSAGKIAFYRATTQMAVFNANGNLGIGNVLPNGARVHIKTDTTNPSLRIEDPLIEGPAGGTAGRALKGWLPIMTGALATDKVYIPLYGPLA
jgi:hypothetical protein